MAYVPCFQLQVNPTGISGFAVQTVPSGQKMQLSPSEQITAFGKGIQNPLRHSVC